MGCMGLFFPKTASAFVGLSARTNSGTSEFRATYGGLWLPLGVVPLASLEPAFFALTGLCWLCAALGRVISIFLDDAADAKNWLAVAFESGFAASLLVGSPAAQMNELLT